MKSPVFGTVFEYDCDGDESDRLSSQSTPKHNGSHDFPESVSFPYTEEHLDNSFSTILLTDPTFKVTRRSSTMSVVPTSVTQASESSSNSPPSQGIVFIRLKQTKGGAAVDRKGVLRGLGFSHEPATKEHKIRGLGFSNEPATKEHKRLLKSRHSTPLICV